MVVEEGWRMDRQYLRMVAGLWVAGCGLRVGGCSQNNVWILFLECVRKNNDGVDSKYALK